MQLPKPTPGEVTVLRVLWRRGASTVRQVLAELEPNTGYTTALKLLQIMADKGLVTRDETARSHVFRAAVPEEQTLGQIADDLLDRVFGGSTQKLLVAALSAKRASPEELRAMRQLIEQAQKNDPHLRKRELS